MAISSPTMRVPRGGRRADVPVRLHRFGVRSPFRRGAVVLRQPAHHVPGLPEPAPQGLLSGRGPLQGLRLLPDGQPRGREERGEEREGQRRGEEGGLVLGSGIGVLLLVGIQFGFVWIVLRIYHQGSSILKRLSTGATVIHRLPLRS